MFSRKSSQPFKKKMPRRLKRKPIKPNKLRRSSLKLNSRSKRKVFKRSSRPRKSKPFLKAIRKLHQWRETLKKSLIIPRLRFLTKSKP
jgi:hypothetical protein